VKVYIGPYKDSITPYSIAKWICFWEKPGIFDEDTAADKLGDWLATNRKGEDSWLTKLCQWYNNQFTRDRKINIKIHNYDSWNADSTIAMLIVPLLKEIKNNKQGFSLVDDQDVPEHLRSDKAPALTQEELDCGNYDQLAPDRWDWILEEMIWSFEQSADDDWEQAYHSGDHDIQIVDGQLIKGPNDTFKIDREGRKAHLDRMLNGRMLFAKYYQGLWT
jgi:hypothetical protein